MKLSNRIASVLLQKDIIYAKLENDRLKYFERNDECIKYISKQDFWNHLLHWLVIQDNQFYVGKATGMDIISAKFKDEVYFGENVIEVCLKIAKKEIKSRNIVS